MQPQHDITQLLGRVAVGDRSAADELLPLVYGELRALAESHFRRERPGHTLQPTALVHEAFVRLTDRTDIDWASRREFLFMASRAMRNILVDHARAKSRAKRGGDRARVTLGPGGPGGPADPASRTGADTLDLLA
ncbi:MAG: ECF-type sigma factor, partial [Planctomycetota bacterium]